MRVTAKTSPTSTAKSATYTSTPEEYAGFVFINMDPNAGSVEEQLHGLADKVIEACPDVHDLKLAARFTTRTPANWKNIVDNYLECYHCGPAHPGFPTRSG